jgi:TetR/AcrR family transcriptional repressor of nem operon
MARPKEFDRETALDAAIGVFWKQGFEATTTQDLTAAMGIGRQSLYDTFGDKRALYVEALGRYSAGSVDAAIALLDRPDSPLEGVAALLLATAALPEAERALGCMGINAVCEFGQSAPDVAAAGRVNGPRLAAALTRRLEEAKARGEIASGLDIRAATRFLQSTYNGLKVSAKGGAPAEYLRDVATFALNSLKAS